MASSLFGQNSNPMSEMLNQFMRFKQQFTGDPQQAVQELLKSGKMSQAQYEQLSQMARQLQGILK